MKLQPVRSKIVFGTVVDKHSFLERTVTVIINKSFD